MITLKELNPHNYILTTEQEANQLILLDSINKIRVAWGKPMTVTSGVRSQADQQRINPSASKSKHLLGAAADVLDEGLELTNWLKKEGANILEEANLFCEDGNKNWVHFQCLPFGSYKPGHSRWFKP